ncbi:glutaredoxin domain-containing protein [Oenococcus oeni]|uniref:glutaredoxin domain-containing protein n=1 Tax=Oenococcus oeni TaxID=1247 RepID=UPI0010B0ECED|nr:glutaredoxin domain-containing protein [Oenococcus oeni]SYW14281.1 Glutaredoxin-like protein NrdH [Oenococcus oeni]
MKQTVIYTKNMCPQCRATKRWLKEHNIDYQEINTTDNQTAVNHLKKIGVERLPFIITDTGNLTGFKPQLLEKLV